MSGAPSHFLLLLQMRVAFTTFFISSSGGALPVEGERLLQLIRGGGKIVFLGSWP